MTFGIAYLNIVLKISFLNIVSPVKLYHNFLKTIYLILLIQKFNIVTKVNGIVNLQVDETIIILEIATKNFLNKKFQ